MCMTGASGSQQALPPSLGRVASKVAGGLTNKEIADELDLPLATVRTYVSRIYQRLGVRNRVELALVMCSEACRDRTSLTPTLTRVADAIARGLSDKEIAVLLDLELATVRTYVRRVYARLGVHNRVQLTRRWGRP
jgi:DNA-binding NarL/FixJ family response regulator